MHERCRSSCSQCESSSNFTFNLVDTKHLNTWLHRGFRGADVLIATSR